MKIIENIADILFPQGLYCVCCGKYIDETRTYSLCDHCIRHMNFTYTRLCVKDESQMFDEGLAAMGYGAYERRLVFDLKYKGETYLARIAAQILKDCLTKVLTDEGACSWLAADVIVPVPIHSKRLGERGFNQAEKIATHLGKSLNVKVDADSIIRVKQTQAQRALSKIERIENIKEAFAVNPKYPNNLKDKKVLLLDDIYTTGATANACARAIRESGASKIYFLALLGASNKNHEFVLEKQK